MSKKYNIRINHHYNLKKQPIVTVVAVTNMDTQEIGLGVAICSKLDEFNGKRGKRIALGRAFKALKEKQSWTRPVNRKRAEKIIRSTNIFSVYHQGKYYKSAYAR